MSERDNALIFCLCVISCTILFAAATIIKLLNQKRRVRYDRVELDKCRITRAKESGRSGSGNVASNKSSTQGDELDSVQKDRRSTISFHPTPKAPMQRRLSNEYEYYSQNNYPSNPLAPQTPLPYPEEQSRKRPQGSNSSTSVDSGYISVTNRNDLPAESIRQDRTQHETTSGTKSVRSESGSDDSNGSHKIEDDSTGPKSSHSKPIDTMHQHSSKSDEDSSEDDDASHPPRTGGETTPDPKSDRSRSESDDSNRSDTSEDKSTGPKSSLQEPSDTMHQHSSKNDEDSPEDDYVFSPFDKMCSIL